MAELVTITIDGKEIQVPAGTLVINAAKTAGIEIPSFCYYDGLALQGACRMCLVEVERAPKLMTACTLPVAPGMVVRTNTEKVVQARKAMLEFLLTNHPLDCPVCDKGGECELQDMVFRYGAGEGRFAEFKHHVPEKQWSPLVFYDAPRCILCYRCVRICDEGLGVKALGVINRGAYSEIAPNRGDHLECDECGMCIDICPVGALTSGTYRYHTRPWEMQHVGTICTHCADGCKTTLGVRDGRIIRANNRDRSGLNDEFLCVKGRFAFDFVHQPERLTRPLIKTLQGYREASWAEAIELVAERFHQIREAGGRIGLIASTRITNEEAYFLQKFMRRGLGSNHIDHRASGDFLALLQALGSRQDALARTADLYTAAGVVILGVDLAQQHPLLAFQIRANYRHHKARVYVVTRGPVREDQIAARSVRANPGEELVALETLRAELRELPNLVVLFGDSIQGDKVERLVQWVDSLGVEARYVCLVDDANSRGVMDMGLTPFWLPGYRPVSELGLEPGLSLDEMLETGELDALWIVGANPLRNRELPVRPWLVVQDLFLTETARQADVILPAASAYEKNGTFTSVCGEVQMLRRAATVSGVKSDLEIAGLIAARMGLEMGPVDPRAVLEELRQQVDGYNVNLPVLLAGGAVQAGPFPRAGEIQAPARQVRSRGDTLFTSGSLGERSAVLASLAEAPGGLYRG